MADASKDGLLLGKAIRHNTAALQFTCGSKQVPGCICSIVLTH